MIGAVIFVIGAAMATESDIALLGALVALGGLGYGLKPLADEFVKNRDKTRAQAELLTCKKLFDEGILSQSEYDRKTEELKKLIF
ncbi:hypothetical protein FGE12_05725 [Aggregicoccus sp. 17bor-14]|uniref:hypothetical protein n=1 Tax=Myxococcaceae TaxID=31 RepID=UPI00129CFCE7|nr:MULTISPECIES: hypothetical protein [Myxococcaceae]MBF5041882.1 hypothetical protein [Simulacricoccus sp. 17bor-14]MRI87663.1 hypothetical protein [Aggregicoccus sp. 17bor-14]